MLVVATSGAGPVLSSFQPKVEKSNPGTSLESCAAACYIAQMNTAGVLDGHHCFCGTASQLGGPAAKALSVPKSECTGVPCQGAGSEMECGGPETMLAYAFSCDKLAEHKQQTWQEQDHQHQDHHQRAAQSHNPALSYSMRIDLVPTTN